MMKDTIISIPIRDTSPDSFTIEHRCQTIRAHHLYHMSFTGYEKNFKKYRIERKGYHNLYVLNYTISGSGLLKIKDKIYTINPGDLMLFSAYEHTILETHPDSDHWEFIFLHLTGRLVNQICEELIQSIGPVITHSSNRFIAQQITDLQVYLKTHKNQDIDYEVSQYLYAIISALQKVFGDHHLQFTPDILQLGLDHINEHFLEIFALNDISKHLSTSNSYFLELFKKYFHTSPMHYVNQLKINRAIYLLKNKSLPLKEIVLLSGFNNERSFLYLFKKYIGMTPKTYRNHFKEY